MDEEQAMWAGKLVDATDEGLAHHYAENGTIGMNAAQIKRVHAYYAAPERGRALFPTGMKGDSNELRNYPISLIQIAPTRRMVDETVIGRLVESISSIGLMHPPIVVRRDGVEIDGEKEDSIPVLVAGRHRLEAWRRLGNSHINCIAVKADEIDAELLEISENLHRAELTALHRDEQVARWIKLTEARKEADAVSRQPDAKPGRPKGGVRAAARELGLSEPDARRAVQVASLAPEAKLAAVNAGLDNNRTALLAAAKMSEPEKQVEIIQARAVPVRSAVSDRDERRKAELVEYLSAAEAIEHLLAEIECCDEGSLQDDLTYTQVAERYKPVMAMRPYLWRRGYGKTAGDISRRIDMARDIIVEMLTGRAEDEIHDRSMVKVT